MNNLVGSRASRSTFVGASTRTRPLPATINRASHWVWVSVGAVVLMSGCAPALPKTVSEVGGKPSTTVWCAGYRTNRDGPHCVRELTQEQARQRSLSWQLTLKESRVVRAVRLNGRGHKYASDDGNVEYAFAYENGRLRETRTFNQFGQVTSRQLYAPEGTKLEYTDEWGRATTEESDGWNSSELRTLDKNNFVAHERYFGFDGKPAKSALGVYASRFERDDRGQDLSTCYFDAQGQPMTSRWGVHCVVSRYDDFGNVSSVQYLGNDRQPTATVFGIASGQWTVDAVGNALGVVWYGIDAKPAPLGGFPGRCTTVRWHVVDGVRVGGECFNEHDEPSPMRGGHAYWRDTVDRQGRVKESRWFGPNGAPIAAPLAARILYLYDERDFLIEKRYFLPDGKPGQRRGPAIVRSERGERDLLKTERYFDAQDRPTKSRGCARRDYEWTRFRTTSSIACFSDHDQPALDDSGVSVQVFHYQPNGLLDETVYVGVDGNPVNNNDGYARSVLLYDSQGSKLKELLFDTHNQPVTLPRFRMIRIRPPFINADWTFGSRESALTRIEAARVKLLAGDDFGSVLLRFGDFEPPQKEPGDESYFVRSRAYPAVRLALDGLNVGDVSRVVEVPSGLFVYQRVE